VLAHRSAVLARQQVTVGGFRDDIEYNHVLWGISWLPPTPIQIYHYATRQEPLTSD
jgi:hypothetical protein